jgi:hypothetical protein
VVDNTAPVLSLLDPPGGALLAGTRSVRWTTLDAHPGTVDLEVSPGVGVLGAGAPDSGVFHWNTTTTPDAAGYQLSVRATDAAGNVGPPSLIDVVVDNTLPVVAVTDPAPGAALSGTVAVVWSTSETHPGTVNVSLLDEDRPGSATTLAAGLADSGRLDLDSTTIPDGARYRIHVQPVDAAGNAGLAAGPSGLAIDNTSPVTALLAPGPGASVGASTTIRWATTDAHPGAVELRLSSDSGATFPYTVTLATPDTGTFAWDTSGVPEGGKYRVWLRPTDQLGHVGSAAIGPGDFRIDHTPPSLTLVSPVGGEVIRGTHTVRWQTIDARRGVVELRLSTDGGATFPIVVATAAPDTGSFVWSTGSVPDGARCRLRLTPTDAAGNVGGAATSPGDFSIANVPAVQRIARVIDSDFDGLLGAGDLLIVPFSHRVAVNTSDPAAFTLPNALDTFGAGASLRAGPAAHEVTVVLAQGASLQVRGTYALGGGASGVDVSSTLPADAIENADTGTDAAPSTPIDVVPAYAPGGELFQSTEGGATFADFDGDGDLDAVTTGQWTTYHRNGGGNGGALRFTPDSSAIPSARDFTVASADVDADGDVDLITGGGGTFNGENSEVLRNDGTGRFSVAQMVGASNSWDVLVGDLDGDGDVDFVECVNGLGGARVWVNDGAGLFTDSGQRLGRDLAAGALGDLDGDGDLDLVVAKPYNNAEVWLNDGLATFTLAQIVTFRSIDVALGDLDGDGDLDVVSAVPERGAEVWKNDGTGQLSLVQVVEETTSRSVLATDADGDGDLDLVFGRWTAYARVWLNDGSGALTTWVELSDAFTQFLTQGDVDGDGDLDILVSGNAGARLWIASPNIGR